MITSINKKVQRSTLQQASHFAYYLKALRRISTPVFFNGSVRFGSVNRSDPILFETDRIGSVRYGFQQNIIETHKIQKHNCRI